MTPVKLPAKVLLVDDDPRVLQSLLDLFGGDFDLMSASSGPEAISVSESVSDIAVVVMDIKMEGMDGITAARQIKKSLPNTAIIFHTGYPGDYDERRIDATEKPFDYVEKGDSSIRLKRAVNNGVTAYHLLTRGRLEAQDGSPTFGLVGQSQAILKVIRDITKVAPSDNKVMILGETGAGKELVAKAIHNQSPRHAKRLAVLHCNHKSPDLIETELFGHKRGAFTSALTDRAGLFAYGNGGTVFLDEIGDLDITTQAKLLRVLESGEYTRVGEPFVHKVDIRLICATHKDLEALVQQGVFREDLYYRLKGIQIKLPTLRERREDIPLLVEYFTERYSRTHGQPPKYFDQEAMDCLIQFDWPGNVRQLLDTIESMLLLADSDLIGQSEVSSYLGLAQTTESAPGNGDGLSARVDAYRRTLVVQALRQSGGNVSAAAELLKTDKANLRKYVLAHEL